MNIIIAVSDSLKQVALQRAVDAYNATASMPITAEQFVQQIVDAQIAAFAVRYLVRVLTKREFLERFTAAERVAIRTAAQSSMAVQDYLELVNVSEEIDLSYATTIGGVQALEAAGLIGEGRAAEILAL